MAQKNHANTIFALIEDNLCISVKITLQLAGPKVPIT